VTAKPEVAVIVPAHRAERSIGPCLDGLRLQTLAPDRFEVHVVDTGEDGTGALVAARAAEWDGRLHYHALPGSGPAAKRNLGADRTEARVLAFTDADCVPDPAWLEAAVARLARGAAIVQGPTATPDGAPPPPFAHAIAIAGPTPLFESCNVVYDAAAFRAAGGFPDDLFAVTGAPFGEDAELAWRVIRGGGTAAFEPRALVRHAVDPPDYARHLRYQWQSRYFALLVRRVPELRRELLTARLFLGPRSLRFTACLAAAALARRYPWAAPLALPYLAQLAGVAARAASPRAAGVGIAKRLVADSVREIALIAGSARHRSPIL
jgi:glycosyltransferase involved in cell wall biosynthesis